jgi:hypothetical protein
MSRFLGLLLRLALLFTFIFLDGIVVVETLATNEGIQANHNTCNGEKEREHRMDMINQMNLTDARQKEKHQTCAEKKQKHP